MIQPAIGRLRFGPGGTRKMHASFDLGGVRASTAAATRSAFQVQGSSRASSWVLVRPETTRSSTSVSRARGSTPFSFAVATRLATWLPGPCPCRQRSPRPHTPPNSRLQSRKHHLLPSVVAGRGRPARAFRLQQMNEFQHEHKSRDRHLLLRGCRGRDARRAILDMLRSR
jgi:hypothetical protein